MPKRSFRNVSNDDYLDDVDQTSAIFAFPDNVMLIVFAHLDTSSLMRASKVCKQWFSLSKDSSLWTRLDLRGRAKALSLKSLGKLSKARFTVALKELYLRGSVGPSKAVLDTITIPFLASLRQHCPKLTVLTLENFDLRQHQTAIGLNISLLPPQLSSLSLKDSMLSHGWFDSLKNNTFNMERLGYLDLSNCTVVSNSDLEAFSYLRSLHTLLLYNCYRISARGIPTIAANLRSLTTLDVSCCPGITDVALHYFGRNLQELKKLNIRFCHHITDSGISSLIYGAKELEYLDIFSCHEVTNQSLKNISQHAKKLKYLDVRSCKVSKEDVDEFSRALPSCRVIFEVANCPSCSHCSH